MKKRITVTIEPDVLERFKKVCAKEGRSLSNMIERVMQAFLVFKKKKV